MPPALLNVATASVLNVLVLPLTMAEIEPEPVDELFFLQELNMANTQKE